jgi:hypothetical protein
MNTTTVTATPAGEALAAFSAATLPAAIKPSIPHEAHLADWPSTPETPALAPDVHVPAALAGRNVIVHRDQALWDQCCLAIDMLKSCYRQHARLAEKLGASQDDTRAQEKNLTEKELFAAQDRVRGVLSNPELGFVGSYPQYLWMAHRVREFYDKQMVVDMDAIWEKRVGFDKDPSPFRAHPHRVAKDVVEHLHLIAGCSRNEKQQAMCKRLLETFVEKTAELMPDISDLAKNGPKVFVPKN